MIDRRFLLFPLLAATLYGCASGSQGGWSSGAGSNVGAGSFTLAPGESRTHHGQQHLSDHSNLQ